MTNISGLVGKTLTEIHVNTDRDEIIFVCNDESKYKMFHYQDCCESVTIEDITGDLDDLLNTLIIVAEERVVEDTTPKYDYSGTATFYCLRTIKGSVDIRWYGSSNGYYSENVDFEEIKDYHDE